MGWRSTPCVLVVALLALLCNVSVSAMNCTAFRATQRHNGLRFQNCLVLKPGKAAMLWRAQGDAVYIHFKIRETDSSQRGWFALGLSTMGSMKGADIAMIHRSDSGAAGTWAVTDCHAVDFITPVRDEIQDWKLLDAAVTGSIMSATVVRRMKTCDLENDIEIKRGLGSFFVFANGPAIDGVKGFDSIRYHGDDRGQQFRQILDLLKPANTPKAAAADAGAVAIIAEAAEPAVTPATAASVTEPHVLVENLRKQLVMSNTGKCSSTDCCNHNSASCNDKNDEAVIAKAGGEAPLPQVVPLGNGNYRTDILCKVAEIPDVETTYMTCYIRMPVDKRYHITKYTTLYGHKTLVHHSVIYACLTDNAQPDVEKLIAESGPGPYNQKTYKQLCEAFYMIGTSPSLPDYSFPSITGLPFGKGSYEYFAIEVHYNNPKGLKGESDPGTGLRLFFTDNLRPNEIGILTVGQFVLDIPPNQPEVRAATSYCPSQCSSRFKQNITLVAQALHMHGLGKSIYTTRTRRNAARAPLATLSHFDYNFQTWIDLPDDQAVLEPGEELSMTCVFDSTGRKNTTHWGFSTQEEMCFWWIYYYPAQEGMGLCLTLGDTELAMCSPEVKDLLDLSDARESGNNQTLTDTVDRIVNSTRALYAQRLNVDRTYNPKQGCNANVPVR